MMAWRRRCGRLAGGRRGVATVELALIIPMFLLMVFGLLEFGHTWYIWHALTNASREGARYAIVYKNIPGTNTRMAPANFNPSLGQFVDGYLLNFFSNKFWDVPPQADWSSTTAGATITVAVTAQKQWFILNYLVPGITAFQLEAKTVMEME